MDADRSVSRLKCLVPSCRNLGTEIQRLSFHTFPERNTSLVENITESGLKEKLDRYKAWKIKLKLHKSPSRAASVCPLHFIRDDFLLPGAPYYWRYYTGKIPSDAIPGGYDSRNRTTYIGQGYIHGQGIIPGVIHPGRRDMSVPIYGVKKATYVKILCSRYRKSFTWLPFYAPYLQINAIKRRLVTGGLENNNFVYMGRTLYQGALVTGKIVDQSYLYFVHENTEMRTETFEYMIYNNSACISFLYN